MKNVMLIWVSAMLGILSILLVMIVYGRSSRSMELKSNLPTVVEATVDEVMLDRKYSINNSQEFVADFVENLVCSNSQRTGL